MLAFKPITIDDYECLNRFLKRYGSSSCQHSFPAMLGLSAKYGDEYCFVEDVLFIHRSHRDHDCSRVYLAPLGDISEDVVRYVQTVIDDAHCHGAKASFETVTGEFKDLLQTTTYAELFDIEHVRDYSEYIYTVDNLSSLNGRPLAPKRNRIRAFYSSYDGDIRIAPIRPSDIEPIRTFTDQWYKKKMVSVDDAGLESESKAISVYLDHFEQLGFSGIAVYVSGEMVGYAAGVPISDDTMDEVIEKGRNDIVGIYQLLCNAFASHCCTGYSFINREEDLGIAGLRRSKESYMPYRLLDKYIIREK